MPEFSEQTINPLPLILVRGFGGVDVEDERRLAYQGFNVGSSYPHKRGENYIYEGFILRLMKSRWRYSDATNVIWYHDHDGRGNDKPRRKDLKGLSKFDLSDFSGHDVELHPGTTRQFLKNTPNPLQTIWVFRYYDLGDRSFDAYGKALMRTVALVRKLVAVGAKIPLDQAPKVNIVAHSMGGLIVRHAIQKTWPEGKEKADEAINKVVTLGTPHQGISFQVLGKLDWLGGAAQEELRQFDPSNQKSRKKTAVGQLKNHFDLDRFLCVAGTDYRSYGVRAASLLNRLFSVPGEFGPSLNRSDGLVKQSYALVPGAPSTFVHKCHGGHDSLVTARESYEIATRFLMGDMRVRLRLVKAKLKVRPNIFGRDEWFFGVRVKPRRVDFELFHQSEHAENSYGPFSKLDFSDKAKDVIFDWAGPNRLIWQGYLNRAERTDTDTDIVMRVRFYVGQRDLFGVGLSDNRPLDRQRFLRIVERDGQIRQIEVHANEDFQDGAVLHGNDGRVMREVPDGWEFDLEDENFEGTFRIELDSLPKEGDPAPIQPSPEAVS